MNDETRPLLNLHVCHLFIITTSFVLSIENTNMRQQLAVRSLSANADLPMRLGESRSRLPGVTCKRPRQSKATVRRAPTARRSGRAASLHHQPALKGTFGKSDLLTARLSAGTPNCAPLKKAPEPNLRPARL